MPATTARSSVDRDFLRYVGELSASWQTSGRLFDRRDAHRVRFPARLRLDPVDDNGRLLMGEDATGPLFVECCDISPQGIRFRHAKPLPYRTVALTFEGTEPSQGVATENLEDLLELDTEPAAPLPPVQMIARLRWCRFTAAALYESGGFFLAVKSGA